MLIGPLIYLSIAGHDMVILHNHKVSSDLLEKRANIYSDRPRFPMASEIMTKGMFIALGGYHSEV